MRSKIIKILLFLGIILIPFGAAKAMDTKAGNSVYISKDEIVSGNLFAAGQTITVDGTISGDLIAAAQTINVNGRVEGDIIAAGQDINVNGDVGGNIRVAGSSINLNGSVSRNINAFGSMVILGNNARVGWDAFLAGATLEIRGIIDGSLSGRASQALLSGKIGKNVDLKLSENNLNGGLTISSGAVINGDLSYSSKKAAKISDKASISGQVEQKIPDTKTPNWFLIWLWAELFAIFSALVVGLVLVFLGKKITPKILEKIAENPLKVFISGLIIMLILPPIALILAFTIIGIPLALIIGAWWLIATYVARIFTAILIGQLIFQKVFKKNNIHLFWSLLLGVTISWLLFAIPFIGWILSLIAIWLGLGGVYTYVTNQFKHL